VLHRQQQHDGHEDRRQPAGDLAHLAPGANAERAVELTAAAEGGGDVARAPLQQDQPDEEQAQWEQEDEQYQSQGRHDGPFKRRVRVAVAEFRPQR
jgi:hypothetical protein